MCEMPGKAKHKRPADAALDRLAPGRKKAKPPEAADVVEVGCNSELQQELTKYDEAIFEHKVFKGIREEEPTSDSGMAPYSESGFIAEIAKRGSYVASTNFYWLSHSYEVQPHVPRHKSRIVALEQHFFREPSSWPRGREMHVALPDSSMTPHVNKGLLKPICVPELRDALRMAVGKAVLDKNTTAATLNKWKAILLSVPTRFEVLNDHKDIHKFVVQEREDTGKMHENTYMSNLRLSAM